MKRWVPFLLFLGISASSAAQLQYHFEHALVTTTVYKRITPPVYKLKPKVDIPVTAATAGWSLYAFSKIYKKDPSTEHEIQQLNKADLNVLDRWAAGLHSQKAANASDIFFYASMPLPLVLLADKEIRSDAGKIALMYVEAMSITGMLYSGSTYFIDRYRPLTYSSEVPMSERTSGNNRNAFFAGHVALVGTSTFFAAKVFSDYHPDSKLRYVFWGAAAAATGATGYLRHRAGKHFPTDIAVGTTVGVLSGILVPNFHKTFAFRNTRLTILPYAGSSSGVVMLYTL